MRWPQAGARDRARRKASHCVEEGGRIPRNLLEFEISLKPLSSAIIGECDPLIRRGDLPGLIHGVNIF